MHAQGPAWLNMRGLFILLFRNKVLMGKREAVPVFSGAVH